MGRRAWPTRPSDVDATARNHARPRCGARGGRSLTDEGGVGGRSPLTRARHVAMLLDFLHNTRKSMREVRRLASAWALSVAAHGVVAGVGALLVAGSLSGRASPVPLARNAPLGQEIVEVELPTMVAGSVDHGSGAEASEATPVRRGGGEGTPRPDR